MIIGRVPFRISFGGGGSDIDTFYRRHYGAVVSTTINKYMYTMIHPYFHKKIRIKYSRTEDVDSVADIQHPLVRECLELMEIDKGIEIASVADVPAGTGLGSSSAFTVCLLQTLSAYERTMRSKEWLAETACRIEIEKLGEPIGKQDQYAASMGGLNYIRFNSDESVFVEPIILKPEIKQTLQDNLLMFYVGNERSASRILREQRRRIEEEDKFNAMREMVKIAEEMKVCLIQGELDAFGALLHEGWQRKSRLTEKITDDHLDDIYATALKAGAAGGKILGAGGGGFFLFYCEPEKQEALRAALDLRELDFAFDDEGARILFYSDIGAASPPAAAGTPPGKELRDLSCQSNTH